MTKSLWDLQTGCVEKSARRSLRLDKLCAPSLVCGRPARPNASGTRPAISQRRRRDIFVEHPPTNNHKLRRSDSGNMPLLTELWKIGLRELQRFRAYGAGYFAERLLIPAFSS